MSFNSLPDTEPEDAGPQAREGACSGVEQGEQAQDSKEISRNRGPALAAAFSEILRRVHEAESVEAVHQESVSGRQELETRFRDSLDATQTDEIATMIAEHGEIRLRRIREKARPEQALDTGERILSREQAGPLGLSDREVEVLTWIARGKRDADIASILGISVRTVGKHVENLLRKMHVESRTAAVAAARHRGS